MSEINKTDEVLIRREDAVRIAEMLNDSIRNHGKFAEYIGMIPPYPEPLIFEDMSCPYRAFPMNDICGYPIDNEGLCVIDAMHTAETACWLYDRTP